MTPPVDSAPPGGVAEHYPKLGTCEQCGKPGRTDYALIKGNEHGRDRSRYRELCRKCHMHYDGSGGARWRKPAS